MYSRSPAPNENTANVLLVKLIEFEHSKIRYFLGKGGKNRRRGKNENENEKRELIFREDGQGNCQWKCTYLIFFLICLYINVNISITGIPIYLINHTINLFYNEYVFIYLYIYTHTHTFIYMCVYVYIYYFSPFQNMHKLQRC